MDEFVQGSHKKNKHAITNRMEVSHRPSNEPINLFKTSKEDYNFSLSTKIIVWEHIQFVKGRTEAISGLLRMM